MLPRNALLERDRLILDPARLQDLLGGLVSHALALVFPASLLSIGFRDARDALEKERETSESSN